MQSALFDPSLGLAKVLPTKIIPAKIMVAIFYPFSLFCEITISLLSLQTQPNTAPNLFQRGVEYGKYEDCLTQTFRRIPYVPENSTPLN